MKQGTLITKITMFVLLAGVVLYLGIYAYRGLTDSFSSTMAYQDILDDGVEVTGVLVRREQVLANGTAIMELLPAEGERVAAGDTVALLYQSQEALERKKTLQSLEREQEQIEAALKSGGSLGDAAQMEKQIVRAIQTLHANTAAGDLATLESDAQALRTLVLRREFTYSASGDSAAVLNQTVAALKEQITQLEAQAVYDTVPVSAPCSGLFSGLADGLESALTPDSLGSVTAGELKSFMGRTSSPEGTPVGKLVTGERWYFATVVDAGIADRLLPGDTVTVGFSKDFTGEVNMRVDRVGEQEPDGCVLVLSADRHLKDVTLLRTQTVSLIFERYTGIRVPKKALHLETVAVPDPDTGERIPTQMLGVYVVMGAQAEYKPVEIVREGNGYYLVTPTDLARNYVIRQNEDGYYMSAGSKNQSMPILYPGDEVIVTAADLYNGKVVLK